MNVPPMIGKLHLSPYLRRAQELSTVSGGVDYSAAHPVFGTIRTRYHQLIKDGMAPVEARKQTRSECWDQVLQICYQYPDNCPAEEQAAVIFAMLIGS